MPYPLPNPALQAPVKIQYLCCRQLMSGLGKTEEENMSIPTRYMYADGGIVFGRKLP